MMRHTEPQRRGEQENRATPPRVSYIVGFALRLLLAEAERVAVLSELGELWERRVEREGEVEARRWYGRQLRGYPLRLLRARIRVTKGGNVRSAAGPGSEPGDGGGFIGGIASDARHALRSWLKSPVLASTIVLTVGLGLGASTAMFAVVRVVLMDPLPYESGDRMVRIYHAVRENRWPLSVVDFQAIEAHQTQFEGVAAYTSWERTLTSGGLVQRVRVRGVTAGWFDLAGIGALHGRTFVASDGEQGTPRTAVVSWGFWQRNLGADESAVGRVIRLDEQDYTVIGILPSAVGPVEERFDIFPVLQFAPPTRRGPFFLQLVGKVRAGTDPRVAAEELRAINERIIPIWATGGTEPTTTWGIMPFDEFVVGRFRTMLLVLLGAV
ncbi:MAG: ABC transporter permease, partial [Longimicrobiales bacterium]